MSLRLSIVIAITAMLTGSTHTAAQQPSSSEVQAEADKRRDQAIRDLLASPPYFVDEQHPGPTMVPRGLQGRRVPLTCRSTQAFSHWATPGAYHFLKAEYLLGLGFDFHGCEISGVGDAWEKWTTLQRLERALTEAMAALQNPRGMEMWRPGAPEYVMHQALKELSAARKKSGDRQRARELGQLAAMWQKRIRSRDFANKGSNQETQDGCGPSDFLRLAARGDVPALEHCLGRGATPNLPGPGGRSALMEAVFAGQVPAVEALLSAGAQVDMTDHHGGTALRDAVVLGHERIVELLLEKGANVGHMDDEGNTALHDAAAMGLESVVTKLLTAGANANATAVDGVTPLLVALEGAMGPWAQQQTLVARRLLAARASPNVQDRSGTTPLMIAARLNQAAFVSDLIHAGARFESVDKDGNSALHHAADGLAVDAARILLESGANPNAKGKNEETPLMVAARLGYGRSPEMVMLLLRYRANPNLANQNGATALMIAAHGYYKSEEEFPKATLQIIRTLAQHGADVRARGHYGLTALHFAAEHPGPDSTALIEFLVDAGFDVNTASDRGTTALMLAAENGQINKVQFLLQRGANARLKSSDGMTALDYAKDWKDRRKYRPGCINSSLGNCAQTREILRAALAATESRGK